MISEIYNLDFTKRKYNYLLKNNSLINNLVTYINEMLNKKEEKEELMIFKNQLSKFLIYKKSFYHHLLFELFYEKHNHTLIPYELLDQLSYYYKHLLNMIDSKKCIKSTDLSIVELKIAYLLDLALHKNPFYKKNILIERCENINERNKFFKYNNDNNTKKTFIKKVSYTKHKINECEYEVEFDIYDKLNELLIQTNLYNYYENLIVHKKMVYNPIPQIYQFYHTVSNIDSYGNILNDLYIEMEEIDGMRLDTYLYKKIFSPENVTKESCKKSLKDIINVYIMICRLLIPLQHHMEFIHCDLKGSNILIGKDRRLRFIDFEYSYMKKDGFHLFSHANFAFNENYNFFNSDTYYTIDLIKLYTSPYRFCSDLLYLFLATLSYKSDNYGIQKYIVETIFKMNNVNMFDVLVSHKLPYEAYVYSKDMDLLKEICNMYFVNFEEFILRFYPYNMINILNIILEELK